MLTRTFFILAIIIMIPAPGWAQEKEGKDTAKVEMEEVVVVGTRTFERIIDIPYSVFRVDKVELNYGKKISAKDVLADVPGLFLQSRFGTHDLRISLRGFGTRSNSGVRGIRILQDGIPVSEPDGETVLDAIDFTSLGGVEVVKGNLSSIYANAPGGVINFISDLYFPESYFSSFNQIGKFGYKQNGFKLGLKENSNRMLLSYNYRTIDGYRQHSADYQHLINTVYEGHIGDHSTVTFVGDYVNGVSKLPGSLTAAEFAMDPFQADPTAISQDFRSVRQKGRAGLKYLTFFGDDFGNEFEVTGYGALKELERADNLVVSFSTRYSLGTLMHFTDRSEIFNRKNVITVGMDYAYQAGPVTDFDNVAGNRGITVLNDFNESLSNIGLYFLNHFNIVMEKLDVFLSGRWDRNVYKRNIYIQPIFTDTSRSFQKFTPKIAFNYKLAPTIALYTSYGTSFDFPALNEIHNTPLSSDPKYSLNPDLNAQTSRNFEFGIKGNLVNREAEFMRMLFFEVTFFKYIVDDEIVPFVINQQTYFRNAAKTNRTGLEVGIKSEPFEEIELVTNYTYTNFKYDEYNAVLFSPSGTSEASYAGNKVPSVPRHILNLILNYEFELSEEISGLLQWDCDYITAMYVNDANTEKTAPYFYGNTMAGITFSHAPFGAIVYFGVSNIFDKRYVGFVNINDFYGRHYETGEPRNVYAGVTANFKF